MAIFTSYKHSQVTEEQLNTLVKEGALLISSDDTEKYKSMKTQKFIVNDPITLNGITHYNYFEIET